MNTMKAVVVHEPRKATVENVRRPDPGTNDVIVEVGACGLCGTDLKIFEGEYLSPYPLVPGHEFAGTVVELGSNVDSSWLGRHVAVDPTLVCGQCEFCQDAAFNHCRSWGALGDTTDGGFAEFVRVPAANVYQIPAGFSFSDGALIEPVACATWAIERLRIRVGGRVLLFGAGPMGLILLGLLRSAGMPEAVVVDRSTQRLEWAQGIVEAKFVRSDEGDMAKLRERYPDGFDLVVDATGSPEVFGIALPWVKKNGQFLLFGVSPIGTKASVEPYLIYHNEVTIVSSMAINHSYGRAVTLSRQIQEPLKKLVTHHLPLTSYLEAISMVQSGRTLKVQLVPSRGDSRAG